MQTVKPNRMPDNAEQKRPPAADNAFVAGAQRVPASGRFVQIDLLRGVAVWLMGMTHGLMWLYLRPVWADHIKYAGIYFCYSAFLLAFGMSLAISALRGGLDTSAGRVRTATRAGVILGAYYLIAFGRYLPGVAHGGVSGVMRESVRLLILLDVPSAGEFLLSFVLFMILAVGLGRNLRRIVERPWLLIAASAACYAIGAVLGGRAAMVVPKSYWHLLFGAQRGDSRPFPVMAYIPLFAGGLLIGKSLLRETSLRRWALRRLAACVIVLGAVGLLSRSVPMDSPAHWARLEPVPGYGFLIGSGALACATLAICGLWIGDGAVGSGIPVKPLIYLGRNSIWIIVWQYVCIQAVAHRVVYAQLGFFQVVGYLAYMTVMPPIALWGIQRYSRRGAFRPMHQHAVKRSK